MSLQGKNILLGICGGIAAYKIPGFIRTLIRQGASVQTILTQNGERFVGRATLSTLTGKEVYSDLFPENQTVSTEHISASDWAHALIVAPATANCLAKFAAGLADDFLSTLHLSLNVPVILAPSMNERMWAHEAVQANVATLKKRGVHIIDPAAGELACGSSGKGRLPSEEVLLFQVEKALTPQDLRGKKILISCGGTAEALDPVRIITNRSSGRMGIRLAVEAMRRGADVTVVHGHVSVNLPEFIRRLPVESSHEMLEAISREFGKNDLLIMAAAVSDFAPASPSGHKLKKQGQGLTLKLKETTDILKTISTRKGKRKIIGFALEDSQGEFQAQKKLQEKNCDLLVLNGPEALGSETNTITLFQKKSAPVAFQEMTKEAAAKTILDYAARL